MHEFAVIILGDWEIVDRMGTRSRTCCYEYALCDPSYTPNLPQYVLYAFRSEGVTPRKGWRVGKTKLKFRKAKPT